MCLCLGKDTEAMCHLAVLFLIDDLQLLKGDLLFTSFVVLSVWLVFAVDVGELVSGTAGVKLTQVGR